ncbi:MAG TPA: HEAT repeat domain-containing protein [Planctomycetota bacterium]|nr:HEAT repeat domain-containing protein [Planctomycetota bacterium]
MKNAYIITLASGFVLAASLISSGGMTEWKAAKEEFVKDGKNNSAEKRMAVTTKLVENMSAEIEPEAAGLLIDQITSELARNKNGKEEQQVNINVIDTCVQGLRNMTESKAVGLIIKGVSNPASDWRGRFYLVKALGGINQAEAIKALTGLIKEKETALQIAALDALRELGAPEGLEPAGKILTQPAAWEVKLAAADYLRKMKSPESIKYISEAIKDKNIESRVLAALLSLLEELNKETPSGQAAAADSGQTRSVILGEYYGTKIESNRIVFVMDISRSMEWATKEEAPAPETPDKDKVVITGNEAKKAGPDAAPPVPEELKKKKKEVDARPVKRRIDSVKKELINTIFNLDSKVYFSIIFYNNDVRIWKKELVPATNENKMDAIKTVDNQVPSGRTNIYDALEAAYKLTLGATKPNEPKRVITGGGTGSPVEPINGADTIFLLTDGNPNLGKIFEPAEMVDAIRKINETRRIKINTIAVGILDPTNTDPMARGDKANTYLMNAIAEITGGTFVDKTQ